MAPVAPGIHDNRFTLSGSYDYSIRTDVKPAHAWDKQTGHSIDEVIRAGQFGKVIKNRNMNDYDLSNKDKIYLPS
jgi:hypothetical protein